MMGANGTTAGTRKRVFVSHARADAPFANQLGAFLHDGGFKPILDRGAPGASTRLGDVIGSADAIVLVLTAAAADSDACVWEVQEAQRLGKPVLLVLPGPADPLGDQLTGLPTIHFYSDPAVPNSGFFDGQRRLTAALANGRTNLTDVPARSVVDSNREAKAEKKAAQRERKELERYRRDEERAMRRIAEAQMQAQFPPYQPRVRFPVVRASILGAFAAAVLAVIFVPGMPDRIRALTNDATAVMTALTAEEEPYSPNSVAAEDYSPERALIAVRGGANVRDYPYTSGDLIANMPQGTRLRVTGRLVVQGKWWYRVVMPDDRVGFVREDVVRWSQPQRTQTASAPAPSVTAVQPAVSVAAGRAGANLRTRPTRSGAPLVRLPAGAAMNVTGKVRQGGHWWLQVTLADGRNGFVRDDVLTADSRASLNLS